MQPALGCALRTALNPIVRSCGSCGRVAGTTRFPPPRRAFHRSVIAYNSGGEAGAVRPSEHGNDGTIPEEPKKPDGAVAEEALDRKSSSAGDSDRVNAPAAQRGRTDRSRNSGLPEVGIPGWFLSQNVDLIEDEPRRGAVTVYGTEGQITFAKSLHKVLPFASDARYHIHANLYQEIITTLNVELALRPPPEEKNITRPITILHALEGGSHFLLGSVLRTMARTLRCDVVRLGAQDLATIVGSYLDENPAWAHSETWQLAYDAYRTAAEEDLAEDEEGFDSSIQDIIKQHPSIREMSTERGNPRPTIPIIRIMRSRGGDKQASSSDPTPQNWNGLKVSKVLDVLIDTAETKRKFLDNIRLTTTDASATKVPQPKESPPGRGVIVHIDGYNELKRTTAGQALLRTLRFVADKSWKGGKRILLVGTISPNFSEFPESNILRANLRDGNAFAEERTIVIPPGKHPKQRTSLRIDEMIRMRLVNSRNVGNMVEKLSGFHAVPGLGQTVRDLMFSLRKEDSMISADIDLTYWSYDVVRRLAGMIIGLSSHPRDITTDLISDVDLLLHFSNEAREGEAVTSTEPPKQENDAELQANRKLRYIKKQCNQHEKNLIGGIRSPSSINTTFDDVHAPPATIDTLKNLTSLSLQRPQAFTYGILRDNKIPGILLYGPPGTGKTMLAKAVAKDSGATVLEVSGASINDKYVGEGEKNVQAIFTLAKKLSPCVIFIDEADALLGARGGTGSRSFSHREIINQFLREWDGMNDHAAVIMVATNRPYDLDEAVLRRLPRRLLIDLPLEADRVDILHKLIDNKETLAEDITIQDLAKRTPFYSGSDLKNVVVAAAMDCLREESAAAASHNGPEPFEFSPVRVLGKRHFDKALQEISASTSDDMHTLKLIRKFDEKYGDQKAKKKKATAMGFGRTMTESVDAEAGRVRTSKSMRET